MTDPILLIAGIFIASGLVLIINPDRFLGVFRKHLESPRLQILTVMLNAVFGAIFLFLATGSEAEDILTVFGIISLSKAVLSALLSPEDFKSLTRSILKTISPIAKIVGLIEAVIGCILVSIFI